MRNQLEMLCQEMHKDAEEEDEQEIAAQRKDFHLQQQKQSQQQQMPRQVMQVRKVRSEIKYLENYTKDKKRESKSDHEFANERDVSRQLEIFRVLHRNYTHTPYSSHSLHFASLSLIQRCSSKWTLATAPW